MSRGSSTPQLRFNQLPIAFGFVKVIALFPRIVVSIVARKSKAEFAYQLFRLFCAFVATLASISYFVGPQGAFNGPKTKLVNV